ncbi:MAG TPA: ABC transporter ATP-binding protein, partial [Ruminococcaceae bacterium]|nr:ABC transporter ATP-binding protein [Oscillospiraceae bacterium]HBG56190.1 ABC transporter ATP-binding protein [Oscillospiraceae bacterium]HBT91264.1 ABC transporter ATP-binding protein [Oscillospiraceae bacterium]
MLSVQNLEVYYGAIHALKGISFEVNEGEIVTLIGANGAGKTTTLHTISGLVKPRSGEITFCGHDLRNTDAHRIIRLGLAQVPEGRRIFSQMTVQENLEMGAFIRKDRDKIARDFERVYER